MSQEFQKRVERRLDEILANQVQIKGALFHLLVRSYTMSQAVDDLTAEVASIKGVVASAVALIQGLRQQIIDAGTDPAKLADLTAALKASEADLAAAVAAPGGSTGGAG